MELRKNRDELKQVRGGVGGRPQDHLELGEKGSLYGSVCIVSKWDLDLNLNLKDDGEERATVVMVRTGITLNVECRRSGRSESNSRVLWNWNLNLVGEAGNGLGLDFQFVRSAGAKEERGVAAKVDAAEVSVSQ